MKTQVTRSQLSFRPRHSQHRLQRSVPYRCMKRSSLMQPSPKQWQVVRCHNALHCTNWHWIYKTRLRWSLKWLRLFRAWITGSWSRQSSYSTGRSKESHRVNWPTQRIIYQTSSKTSTGFFLARLSMSTLWPPKPSPIKQILRLKNYCWQTVPSKSKTRLWWQS